MHFFLNFKIKDATGGNSLDLVDILYIVMDIVHNLKKVFWAKKTIGPSCFYAI